MPALTWMDSNVTMQDTVNRGEAYDCFAGRRVKGGFDGIPPAQEKRVKDSRLDAQFGYVRTPSSHIDALSNTKRKGKRWRKRSQRLGVPLKMSFAFLKILVQLPKKRAALSCLAGTEYLMFTCRPSF